MKEAGVEKCHIRLKKGGERRIKWQHRLPLCFSHHPFRSYRSLCTRLHNHSSRSLVLSFTHLSPPRHYADIGTVLTTTGCIQITPSPTSTTRSVPPPLGYIPRPTQSPLGNPPLSLFPIDSYKQLHVHPLHIPSTRHHTTTTTTTTALGCSTFDSSGPTGSHPYLRRGANHHRSTPFNVCTHRGSHTPLLAKYHYHYPHPHHPHHHHQATNVDRIPLATTIRRRHWYTV